MKNNVKYILFICLNIYSIFLFSQNKYKLESQLQQGHIKYITTITYSPNGKYIASGSYDNTIILWNIKNGREIRTFNQHTKPIESLEFSVDGSKILSSSADNTVIIFDIITAKVILKINTDKNLRKAVFSSDGTKILTMDNRDKTTVWSALTGEKLGEYKKSFSSKISPYWFSPDGSKLLSYFNYKKASLIDLKTKKRILNFDFDKTNSFCYSSNGKYIAIGSSKLFAKVFDSETGKLINYFKNSEKEKCDGCDILVAFSHNNKLFLTGTTRTDLVLWNIKSGKKIKSLYRFKNKLSYIKFSLDDKYVLAKTNDEVFIFDVKSGKKIFNLKNNLLYDFEPKFSPDSKTIAFPYKRNTIAIYNISSSKIIKILKGYLNKPNNNGLSYRQTDWTVKNLLTYISNKSSISISPNGKYIIKGQLDSIFIMIDIETGKKVKEYKGHSKIVLSYDFSPDGKTIVSCGGDHKIILWDTETAKPIKEFNGHKELIFDVKFSSDGKYIISGSWDGTLRVWNVKTNKNVNFINLKTISPYVVGFTPNNLYAISADLNKKLKFWELDANKEFREIIGHTNIISSFDFTDNKKQMITSSWDGTVKLWDLLTGMLLMKFTNHNGAVNSVACYPNKKIFASASSDRTIKIINYETGKEIKTLTGHSTSITSVKFTPDGSKLISCSIDGVIKVWETNNFSEIYTYIQIDRNNWLAKNKFGYFDGSKDALKLVNYVSGLEVLPVNSLFEKFFTPNLIKRIMSGEKFSDTNQNINQTLKQSPDIKIKVFENKNLIITSQNDSTYKWRQKVLPINVDISEKGSKLDEIRIYNNGKLVLKEPLSSEILFRGTKNTVKSYNIKLNNGKNKIKTVVLNKERTESLPAQVTVNYDGKEALKDLFVLAIGINKYKNPDYNLNYAANDAKSYIDVLKKNSKKIFNNVNITFLKNDEANKENIFKKINELSKKVGPEDVFIFYYAGHGVMRNDDKNKHFYIIPHNITDLYCDINTLNKDAISADELLNFSINIKAEKQLFILDACQSGAALNTFATGGLKREKAIAQLARTTGTFFLTAAEDVQYANEIGNLKHGTFTYAILEALEGKADGGLMDKKITVNEMKTYVEARVPQLTKKYNGSAQYPSGFSFGHDFPLVFIK